MRGESGRIRFLLTKMVEVSAFRKNIKRNRKIARPKCDIFFPLREVPNKITERSVPVVVVPTFLKGSNDLKMLDELISCLKDQSLEGHIVIVDDASPEPVPNYSDVHCLRLPQNSGPASARNKGMDYAQTLGAKFIAFTDSDCLPSDNWLHALREGFLGSPSCHILSGNTLSHDRCWLGKYHERNGTLNGRRISTTDRLLYGPTCNLAISACLAEKMRFDESFPIAAAEDIDLCYRANKTGWAIEHCPEAIIHHNYGYTALSRPEALIQFWRQFKRYAEGESLLLTRHLDYYNAFLNSKEITARPVAD
ncbi:glycosyltransferase [Pseudodesulfovibrio sp. zrk46]|uniref:glycosyltransferase family 2 protein n=1 Tax=Pseudodesulfovibrio sp. zrk46 TaxID=2725288 RepID=UPI001449FE39|nr:glycosyltransferase [Pseudodesulfovibrio sp. zrk46]QJB55927.1 glycosyltransferase [Pseudodesulfovibrio sp. zrk46]